MRVPTPAVNSATLGSSPVSSGTSTKAPNATNNICAPVRITLSGESFDNGALATDSFIGVSFLLWYVVLEAKWMAHKNAPGSQSQGRWLLICSGRHVRSSPLSRAENLV